MLAKKYFLVDYFIEIKQGVDLNGSDETGHLYVYTYIYKLYMANTGRYLVRK
jgi:hypothetical protein